MQKINEQLQEWLFEHSRANTLWNSPRAAELRSDILPLCKRTCVLFVVTSLISWFNYFLSDQQPLQFGRIAPFLCLLLASLHLIFGFLREIISQMFYDLMLKEMYVDELRRYFSSFNFAVADLINKISTDKDLSKNNYYKRALKELSGDMKQLSMRRHLIKRQMSLAFGFLSLCFILVLFSCCYLCVINMFPEQIFENQSDSSRGMLYVLLESIYFSVDTFATFGAMLPLEHFASRTLVAFVVLVSIIYFSFLLSNLADSDRWSIEDAEVLLAKYINDASGKQTQEVVNGKN